MPDDGLSAIQQILYANRQKSFVQRILDPQRYPVLYNDDGSVSTHRMAYTTDDTGKAYVYPTILLGPDNNLTRFDPNEAWQRARSSGNYITFPDAMTADWFSKNYKSVWNK